jgi:hypothetical protein
LPRLNKKLQGSKYAFGSPAIEAAVLHGNPGSHHTPWVFGP